jgi:hypothetical protein
MERGAVGITLAASRKRSGAGGGTRTHKARQGRRILSPVCIPFHHTSAENLSELEMTLGSLSHRAPQAY